MKRIAIIIVLLLSHAQVFADSASTSKSVFELYGWLMSPSNLYYHLGVDSTIVTYPLFLEPNPELRGQIGFTVPFFYANEVKSRLEVKVRYKSENWNLGHYMKNEYKDDYSNIALVTRMGNFLANNGYSKIKEEKLQISPFNSLEYLMNRQGIDLCYLSMKKFTYSDVISIRFIGNRNRHQPFISIIPKSRMDGVIFIKKSSAIHKSDEILNKSFDVNILTMDAFMRASEKRKKIQLEN